MRIIFMGSPEFALPSLGILLEHHHEISAVVTVPDKPAGRGLTITYSPVKKYAVEKNIPVFQPVSLKDEKFIDELRKLKPDLFVVVAFRILPPEIYTIPKYGSFNLHASLLPKYRGAAPINWTVIKGEKETGVTTFFLQEKVDTGSIILQARTPIEQNETAGDIHDKLADIGAEVVLHTVNMISINKVALRRQNDAEACPAPKLFKDMCKIDWKKSAKEIHNFIRGLSPKPTAFTFHKDKMIKIYRTCVAELPSSAPGVVLMSDKRIIVGTGEGTIEILELQQEGKKKLSADEFLRGYFIEKGDSFQ
jgi:methionyl-tRNA formyltransferase